MSDYLIIVLDQVVALVPIGCDNSTQICDGHLVVLNQDSLQVSQTKKPWTENKQLVQQ